jgi:cytochrome c-type biogenesis protein CcmH/NrfG
MELAHASLQTSLKQNPDDPQTYYVLSRVLARMGDDDGARSATETFQKLKQAAPTGTRRQVPPAPGRNQ